MGGEGAADEFAEFNAEYRRSVPERLREVDALWSELRQGHVSRERMHALLRVLHSIAGSAGTFGLQSLSDAAAAAESCIQPFCERAAMPDESGCLRFESLIAEVKQAAA